MVKNVSYGKNGACDHGGMNNCSANRFHKCHSCGNYSDGQFICVAVMEKKMGDVVSFTVRPWTGVFGTDCRISETK